MVTNNKKRHTVKKRQLVIAIKPMKKARGMFKGMDTTIEREPDREL